MIDCSKKLEIELFWVIVNYGKGSEILHYAKKHGITGGTVMIGKGTVNCRYLEVFDLCETRREVLMMLTEKQVAVEAMEKIGHQFHFEKPNHGIAFSLAVEGLYGSESWCHESVVKKQSEVKPMYQIIVTIVEKGKADEVMESATKAGARGGTVLNARGSGLHETQRLFSLDIEPERDIVLIITESDKTEAITSAIRKNLNMNGPGHGLLFVQNITRTIGLYPSDQT